MSNNLLYASKVGKSMGFIYPTSKKLSANHQFLNCCTAHIVYILVHFAVPSMWRRSPERVAEHRCRNDLFYAMVDKDRSASFTALRIDHVPLTFCKKKH